MKASLGCCVRGAGKQPGNRAASRVSDARGPPKDLWEPIQDTPGTAGRRMGKSRDAAFQEGMMSADDWVAQRIPKIIT